ncbi:glycine cleavage system t protein [Diplocarpon rosae]|nr:glycine cleavage system t protein [Diplocarpon rosae]
MSPDPPPYLSSLQNNIRSRPIPWDGAVRAGTITDDQLSKIRSVDKVRKEHRKEVVEGDLDGFRTLFLGSGGKPGVIESAAKRGDVVQYILVLLSDLLDGTSALAKALSEHPKPYNAFLPLLQSTDLESAIPLLTSTVLTAMIAGAPSFSQKEVSAIPKLSTYLSTLTKSTDGGLQDIAVLQYSTLLRGKITRQLFWEQRGETVGPLVDILTAAAGVSNGDSASASRSGAASIRSGPEGTLGGGVGLQLLYHVLLVLWQLSFEGAGIGEGLDDEFDIISLFTQLLRLSPKEKTTRLLISSLYNLLSTNRSSLLPAAVLARLPALLQNINGRHFSDPDLLDDLKNLSEMLDEYTRTQTTFDEYAAEVNSGHLRWSPPHKSPTFWVENARRILDQDKGALPKKLAEIMGRSWESDKQVLAIACNDVGALVKEVPERRDQLEKLGLKTRVMELMQEPDETRTASRNLRPLSTALHRTSLPTSEPHPFFPSSLRTSIPAPLFYAKRYYSSPPQDEVLQKTPLYDLHLAHSGKMVGFGGFHMPVQYSSLSVSASHHFTRSNASLFDVSHMVQHRFSGPGVNAFLERVTPAGIAGLETHKSTLSTLLWPVTGGIVDDTILTRLGPELFYVVTNAGCRKKDLQYLGEQLEAFKSEGGAKVEWELLDGWGLIALQGPLSADILGRLVVEPAESELKTMYFGSSKFMKIKLLSGETSSPLLVSRAGYTGEDGFEISIPESEAVAVTETLLQSAGPEQLQLAGLGARDSLRLEAGMCLYGHDLDDSTTPVEAALSWVIGKDRRTSGGFHGSDVILKQLTPKSKGGRGVERRRIGLIVEGAPAREGAAIVNDKGEHIGQITSGCPSPTLGKNIAMGYIKDGFHKSGTEVEVVVRGKKRKAEVTKMPFVPSKYWKGAAPS